MPVLYPPSFLGKRPETWRIHKIYLDFKNKKFRCFPFKLWRCAIGGTQSWFEASFFKAPKSAGVATDLVTGNSILWGPHLSSGLCCSSSSAFSTFLPSSPAPDHPSLCSTPNTQVSSSLSSMLSYTSDDSLFFVLSPSTPSSRAKKALFAAMSIRRFPD